MASRYDLVIVGMGSAGIVAAEFARTLDLRVAAVERDRIGGDCLWTGCVPSKALIATARAAHAMRAADRYGLTPVEPEVDAARIFARIRAVQEEIAATDDSPERLSALGVDVRVGEPARITGPHTVAVGGATLETRYVLLCTGSRPATPAIDGLADAGFLNSETFWDLGRLPASVVFVGAGPVSIELAQALHRLGVAVTVLERGRRILRRDEPELAEALAAVLRAEGVDLRSGVRIERVIGEDGARVVSGTQDGEPRRWAAEAVFVGAGRTPTVEGLGLDELGIAVADGRIATDDRLRTAVRSIYAVGDVAGRERFTHTAGYAAARAVRDMFFPGRGKAPAVVPWCTFTDPELAHAGMTSIEAVAAFGADAVELHRGDLAHSDRARTDAATAGGVTVVTHKGRVVGAHLLAPAAGELIHELALAIHERLKLKDLAGLVHVYPTYATTVGLVAAEAAYADARRYRWLVRRAKG
jgi:pyruvate/2-oxoglutarate dehydrogenase complex dihydrolipoamide dehydrogenase (E3) component